MADCIWLSLSATELGKLALELMRVALTGPDLMDCKPQPLPNGSYYDRLIFDDLVFCIYPTRISDFGPRYSDEPIPTLWYDYPMPLALAFVWYFGPGLSHFLPS